MRPSALAVAACLLALVAPAAAHLPVVEPAELFADGLDGPEGIAFTKDGGLIVGSTTGQIRRYTADGSFTVLAEVGDSLAGITVLKDGRILAAAFAAGRIWAVDPKTGDASVFVDGLSGPNFILQTRRKHIYVSASLAGTIVDVTDGVPVVRAAGLVFPNGLAKINRFMYIAETFANRISRVQVLPDGTLGPPEPFHHGIPLPDGLCPDRPGNLLVAASGILYYVPRPYDIGDPEELKVFADDPLFFGPSNLAYGRGRTFRGRTIYVVNYGPALGNGTSIVRFHTNHAGRSLIH
jgi:sugar lactone lactonase YvrE